MTNLPSSTQSGDLDNISVSRAEFRTEIGILLEYVAQALGGVSGNYTTETVDPLAPILQGTPTLEVGAEPVASDESLRCQRQGGSKRTRRLSAVQRQVHRQTGCCGSTPALTPTR